MLSMQVGTWQASVFGLSAAAAKLDGLQPVLAHMELVFREARCMATLWVPSSLCSLQPNERALLTMLVARLRQIDADVFVGHNFAAFDLDVLLHRLQHHKASLESMCSASMKWQGGDRHQSRCLQCCGVWLTASTAYLLPVCATHSAGAQLEQPGPAQAQPLPQPRRRWSSVWWRCRRWRAVRCACCWLVRLQMCALHGCACLALHSCVQRILNKGPCTALLARLPTCCESKTHAQFTKFGCCCKCSGGGPPAVRHLLGGT